jgi:hypothetical protein
MLGLPVIAPARIPDAAGRKILRKRQAMADGGDSLR